MGGGWPLGGAPLRKLPVGSQLRCLFPPPGLAPRARAAALTSGGRPSVFAPRWSEWPELVVRGDRRTRREEAASPSLGSVGACWPVPAR